MTTTVGKLKRYSVLFGLLCLTLALTQCVVISLDALDAALDREQKAYSELVKLSDKKDVVPVRALKDWSEALSSLEVILSPALVIRQEQKAEATRYDRAADARKRLDALLERLSETELHLPFILPCLSQQSQASATTILKASGRIHESYLALWGSPSTPYQDPKITLAVDHTNRDHIHQTPAGWDFLFTYSAEKFGAGAMFFERTAGGLLHVYDDAFDQALNHRWLARDQSANAEQLKNGTVISEEKGHKVVHLQSPDFGAHGGTMNVRLLTQASPAGPKGDDFAYQQVRFVASEKPGMPVVVLNGGGEGAFNSMELLVRRIFGQPVGIRAVIYWVVDENGKRQTARVDL